MKKVRFQTIVVGVDFSNYSKLVAKQALLLAEENAAKLVFVYAISTIDFTAGETFAVNMSSEFIKPLTQEIYKVYELEELSPNKDIDIEIKVGRACDAIMNVAASAKDPLIVVGHKGAGSFMGRFFIGSTAEELALRSPTPVWIHRGYTTRKPKKILLPCDFSPEVEASFELAQSICEQNKNEFEFFYVSHLPLPLFNSKEWQKKVKQIRKNEEIALENFQQRFPEIPLKKKQGDVAQLLSEEARKFDLVVMAPHHREGLFSGFGSVTAKVVRSGRTPILIAH